MADGVIVEDSVVFFARKLESGIWLGRCEALGIYLEADDLDDLYEQFRDAFTLVATDMLEEGEVDDLVKALRKASGGDWKLQKIQDRAGVERCVSAVPWHMIPAGQSNALTQEVA